MVNPRGKRYKHMILEFEQRRQADEKAKQREKEADVMYSQNVYKPKKRTMNNTGKPIKKNNG